MERICTGIGPNVGAMAAVLSEFNVIDMSSAAVLPDENELMLATIERAHSSIVLVPDRDIFELMVDAATRRQHLIEMTPIHANKVDGAIGGMLGKKAEQFSRNLTN